MNFEFHMTKVFVYIHYTANIKHLFKLLKVFQVVYKASVGLFVKFYIPTSVAAFALGSFLSRLIFLPVVMILFAVQQLSV